MYVAAVATAALVGALLTPAQAGTGEPSQRDRTTVLPRSAVWQSSAAPGGPGWRTGKDQDRVWRRLELPVPQSRGRGRGSGDLLLRRAITVPTGAKVLVLRLGTDSPAVIHLDGQRVRRVGVGTHRLVVRDPARGRTKLAVRLIRSGPKPQFWLRAVASRSTTVAPGPNVVPGGPGTPAAPTPGPGSGTPPVPTEPTPTSITRVCTISDSRLPEISGMAAGVRDQSVLWVHNDSGDSARLFAVDRRTCAVRAIVRLAGVTAGDIEGMAMGRAEDGSGELWVGDFGDNSASRPSIRLYRLPEPTVADQSVPVRTVTVTWTPGARDCESIAVDPVPGGDVYLVSKESTGGIYRLRGDFRTTGTATTGSPLATTGTAATDAAIAPDRSRSVIRFYTAAELRAGVLPGSQPVRRSMPTQRQGEAIAFAPDSRSIYLASEGSDDLIRVPLSVWTAG